MEKEIIFFGQKAKIGCDEKCNKAWGINNRPQFFPELGREKLYGYGCEYHWPGQDPSNEGLDWDDDNSVYLPDNQLGEAPENPGTYEGGHAKPTCDTEKGNKWCARECERCAMSKPGEWSKPLTFPDFEKEHYNIPITQ